MKKSTSEGTLGIFPLFTTCVNRSNQSFLHGIYAVENCDCVKCEGFVIMLSMLFLSIQMILVSITSSGCSVVDVVCIVGFVMPKQEGKKQVRIDS